MADCGHTYSEELWKLKLSTTIERRGGGRAWHTKRARCCAKMGDGDGIIGPIALRDKPCERRLMATQGLRVTHSSPARENMRPATRESCDCVVPRNCGIQYRNPNNELIGADVCLCHQPLYPERDLTPDQLRRMTEEVGGNGIGCWWFMTIGCGCVEDPRDYQRGPYGDKTLQCNSHGSWVRRGRHDRVRGAWG